MNDIVSGGPDRPPWKPPRWLIVTGLVVAGVAIVVMTVVTAGGGGGSRPAAARSSSAPAPVFPDGADATVRPDQTPGLVVSGAGLGQGSTLNRRDRTADSGPWAVSVRRRDGSLGRHGAVVTFPVPQPPSPGRRIQVGTARGTAGDGEITWRIGGAYARVRGDLPQPDLLAIAVVTSLRSGRPTVDPPRGFSVTATGPAWPRTVREARYGSRELGEAAALSSGLTYTQALRAGGLEDELYAVDAQLAGTVHGKPAVITSALGGNGLLAWEPQPGLIACVGYSGASLTDHGIAALRRIAERTRLVTPARWQETGPQTVNQVNHLG